MGRPRKYFNDEVPEVLSADSKTDSFTDSPADINSSDPGFSIDSPVIEKAPHIPTIEGTIGEVRVYNINTGAYIRTYSLQVHGKNYRNLAEEFSKKVGGVLR